MEIKLFRAYLDKVPVIYFQEYGEYFAKVILGIKDQGITSAIGILAKSISQHWPEELWDSVLVPIPSSPANNLRRGYSHTKLLARSLARAVPGITVVDLLISAKPRLDQSNLGFDQRKKNLAGAFQVRNLNVSRKILLFDDILTTGATLQAAKQSLELAGFEVAGYVVLSRVRPLKPE
ncbi:MAG: hypothetical protein RIQ88_803 [Actinomycetota bacterium]